MNKKITIIIILLLVVIFFGVFGITKRKDSDNKIDDNIERKIDTVIVESGSITPTLSNKTAIKSEIEFIVQAENKGIFKSNIIEGDKVKKGQIIGSIDSNEIKAPADATVIKVSNNNLVPKNYPLFYFSYSGFSIEVKADNFLRLSSDLNKLKARFQVDNGVGPSDIMAIVYSSNDPMTLECLIGIDDEVREGDLATVVVVSELKKDVMKLPVTVVAGRIDKGMVTRINGDKFEEVEVKLGVTDGAYIEILDGLNVGDKILGLAPNLDPKLK